MVVTKKFIQDTKVVFTYGDLLGRLSIQYQDISLYILAFIHRSIVNERPDKAPEHNERLEFLGDAILELVITESLFLDFPQKPEGDLTDIRSSIVRGRNLAKVGKQLEFSKYLFLGKGEEQSGGRENEYLLANCVEAFIGAIYLDSGYETAKAFILKHIYSTLQGIINEEHIKDFKTLFQEYSQAQFDLTPNYEILQDTGPDHDKSFITGAYVGEKLMGEGQGSSKKKSQEVAAKNAFLKLTKKI